MAEVRLRPRAEDDLADIRKYTKDTWSATKADVYISTLLDMMEALAEQPNRGRSAEDFLTGAFKQKCRSHVIFYLKAAYGVEIVRVLHGRMDFTARLSDD